MTISDWIALFALIISLCSSTFTILLWRKQSRRDHAQYKTTLMHKALSISIDMNIQQERCNAILNRWNAQKILFTENDMIQIRNSMTTLQQKEEELRELHTDLQTKEYEDIQLQNIERNLNFHTEHLKGHLDALTKVESAILLNSENK